MPTPTSATDGTRSAAPRARRSATPSRSAGAAPPSFREGRQALGLLMLLLVMLPAYGLSRQYADDGADEAETTEADTTDMRAIIEHIRDTAARHGVSEHLVAAVIAVESEFYPRAVSRKGARGLMQLMPATASIYNVRDPFDPRENIDGGVRHLKRLLRRYDNNLPLVLAAYNAGEQAVKRHGGIPPYRETRQYVRRVLRKYERAALMPPAPAAQVDPSAVPAAAVQPEPSAAPAAAVQADRTTGSAPVQSPARAPVNGRNGAAIRVDRARTQSSPPPRRAPVPGKGTRALAPAAAVVGLA